MFGATTSWSKPDPVLHYRMVPNAKYWFTKENDHPIGGRINNFGWRDNDWTVDKPAGRTRVALLGDSFVEAFQVELDSTFAKITERHLRDVGSDVEVMNFGRSGFAQTEELIVLREDAIHFAPDIVVLFFLPGNDILDVSRETAPHTQRPFFTIDSDGALELDNSFAQTREFKLRGFASRLKRTSALASLVIERVISRRDAGNRQQQFEVQRAESPQGLTGMLTLCTDTPNEKFVRSYEMTKALIREIADVCRLNGQQLLLVCLNTREYLPRAEAKVAARDPSFDLYYFDDDMAGFAETLGVEYIGLQRPFRAYHEATGRELLWAHFNYEGHRLVADILTDKLLEMMP